MQLMQSKHVMLRVREFFAKGHKTNNKFYHETIDGHSNDEAKADDSKWDQYVKRHVQAQQSHAHMPVRSSSDLETAQNQLRLATEHRSGNCVEMAILAGYFAVTEYRANPDTIFLCAIKPPGDHFFCLVSPGPFAALKEIRSLAAFDKRRLSPRALPAGSFAIDPWLNVACGAGDYMELAVEKLNKWGAAGKRIHWPYGKQGSGVYPADGEYKDQFARAPIAIREFQY